MKKPLYSPELLETLGIGTKEMDIYMALLRLGTAPLRLVAEEAHVNRGLCYDALKRLVSRGLAGYVDAKRHRYFRAEDPGRLRALATKKEVAIEEAREELGRLIPLLQATTGVSEYRPAVRYLEGTAGVHDLLEDVLRVSEETRDRLYRVYSSAGLRDLISAAWPRFKEERVRRGVRVRAISIGEGGTTVGLDERRWLSKSAEAPSYIFIYAGKTACVAQDRHRQLFGVITEDAAIAKTQQLIFDALWKQLPS
ncbi:TrmB family transcriptional regulator [Candidatus Uhrbacteria bacterium]|nr:TrmB family transcriptional regulator [Candidatus Uhrbacteria bacterium]